jgi:methionyl-tRNA formyltransferase
MPAYIIQPSNNLSVNTQSRPNPDIAQNRRFKVVFMGTPEFAAPILKELFGSEFRPSLAICGPDRPVGRGQQIAAPPVKTLAQEMGIRVAQPETKNEIFKEISAISPDLIIVAAYGKILTKEILDLPKFGAINVHPSLLPKYRGSSPIESAILNGDKTTGVTIMLMNEKMDAGPIISQKEMQISENENAVSLEKKLSELGAKLLSSTLKEWISLKEMPEQIERLIYPQQQDDSRATYTRLIKKQDGRIIWNKTAEELERQVRAFFPWPGSFSYLKDETGQQNLLKIIKAGVLALEFEKQIGEVFLTKGGKLVAQTGKGCLIFEEIQLEGGKAVSAADFLNGHPEIIGKILE